MDWDQLMLHITSICDVMLMRSCDVGGMAIACPCPGHCLAELATNEFRNALKSEFVISLGLPEDTDGSGLKS